MSGPNVRHAVRISSAVKTGDGQELGECIMVNIVLHRVEDITAGAVSSVEPSFTQMASRSGMVCARMESREAPTEEAALKTGRTIETFGMGRKKSHC